MRKMKSENLLSTFSFPTKVLFGPGAIQEVPRQLADLKIKRPLIVTDAGVVSTEAFKRLEEISKRKWPVFSQVQSNPLIEDVEAAMRAYRDARCDSVIAFGGGSPLD